MLFCMHAVHSQLVLYDIIGGALKGLEVTTMVQTQDYTWGETLYEGPETCIRRATHTPSGEHLVAKSPTSDAPSLRVLGRLAHEYQILGKLSQVAGVARAHAFH